MFLFLFPWCIGQNFGVGVWILLSLQDLDQIQKSIYEHIVRFTIELDGSNHSIVAFGSNSGPKNVTGKYKFFLEFRGDIFSSWEDFERCYFILGTRRL